MSMNGTTCTILIASPRPHGNCERAAEAFSKSFAATAGFKPGVLRLREYRISPCSACDACGRFARQIAKQGAGAPSLGDFAAGDLHPPFGCPLAREDGSPDVLTALATAPALCIISPIYFYHLPAQLKALLDRLQSFWSLRRTGVEFFAGGERRPCRPILIGGRPKGEKLFQGSLLSFKYSLDVLGIRMEKPLLLYGLDGPDELDGNREALDRVTAYASAAALASKHG